MSGILDLVGSSLDSNSPDGVRLFGMTVRVDEFDRDRVDLLSSFLGVSRQRFLHLAVQDAIASAVDAITESESFDVERLTDALFEIEQAEIRAFGG